MIVIPQNNSLPPKGVLGVSNFVPSISSTSPPEAQICKKDANFTRNEPVSVLDTRSPSPSASSSSCSYGAQNGGNIAVPGTGKKEELVAELQPLTVGVETEKSGLGFGDLDNLLPEFAGSDQSFLRWISGDVEDPSVSLKQLLQGGNGDLGCGFEQQVNLLPPQQFQPKPLIVPKLEAAGGGGNGNLMVPRHQLQEQQFIYDQIFQASELLLAGHFSNAQMILARLNQQLSPVGKPSRRAAFYIKEALQLPFLLPCASTFLPPRNPTPFDCVLKMDAYKAFSEISPLIQFMNFTSNQAILEALGDAEQIHIIDFDIGFGAQWSSFMQELPNSSRKASLKITAFASPSTHHSIEIGIMHESLTQFANDAGIRFELEVINLDSFDPKSYPLSSLRSSECEAIAINFPIWSISSCPFAFPSLLHFMKQLSPKVVVSLERGCERTELPLKHHLLHALQYYEILLASIDAANLAPDIGKKIERSLLQPSIENMILGRLRSPDRMSPWRNLFASAGFSPVACSNMTEIQAECVVKRTQVGGFHVEKRQTSLVLCWKQQELLSAVTWRC
ncbi:scarecrow-like protein 6 isoform X2 [Lycium barbarum]|uniref:scarecrow-like protein 6 isoform X2 n=1 Tax=Lycium barbarum TaxID=112863 RepID=UPI00293E7445|nr:scarecrow-like protein 6 isoform X2 [Lycium barbarum]